MEQLKENDEVKTDMETQHVHETKFLEETGETAAKRRKVEENDGKPKENRKIEKKKQEVDKDVTKPKEISGYEKMLKLKRKSGIVFLNYQEDQMILEHEEKVQAEVSGKGQGQIDVKPNKKRGSSSIKPKAEPVSGHSDSTSEKKPKPSTSRQPSKRRRRRSTRKKFVYSSSSESEEEAGSSSDPDECDQGPPPPQQKRRRNRRSKILTPVTRDKVEEVPTIGKISFLEMIQMSKSNVTKKSPEMPVLQSIHDSPVASSSRRPTPPTAKARGKPAIALATPKKEILTRKNVNVSNNFGRGKRHKIMTKDVEYELSLLVKNLTIHSTESKAGKKAGTKLTKKKLVPLIKVELGIPKLSDLEENFVQKGHCFRLKNYFQGRRFALSERMIRKWKPAISVSAGTGFSEEKRREKQLRLQKLTGNMKNSTRAIPLALTRPIQNISDDERTKVSAGHVFLLRNLNRTHRLIKSRLFWTKEAPKPRRLAKIPLKIFDPKDDKLSNYFSVPEIDIPEETTDQKTD